MKNERVREQKGNERQIKTENSRAVLLREGRQGDVAGVSGVKYSVEGNLVVFAESRQKRRNAWIFTRIP